MQNRKKNILRWNKKKKQTNKFVVELIKKARVYRFDWRLIGTCFFHSAIGTYFDTNHVNKLNTYCKWCYVHFDNEITTIQKWFPLYCTITGDNIESFISNDQRRFQSTGHQNKKNAGAPWVTEYWVPVSRQSIIKLLDENNRYNRRVITIKLTENVTRK